MESRAGGDALSGNGNEGGWAWGTLGLLEHALHSEDLMDRSNYDNHGRCWLTHQTSHSFLQGILPSQRQSGKPECWG